MEEIILQMHKEYLKGTAVILGLLLSLVAVKSWFFKSPANNLHANSVMITNRGMDHGGTGVILSSSESESVVLTNDHVCKAVKFGGIVQTSWDAYQIVSMIESEVSDLCMVTVATNLGVNTTVAQRPPNAYEKAIVAGHPALMPNVLSTGHFSGRRIINVMTGFKPCTDAQKADPNTVLLCAFFGGTPIVKAYESVLVTATIMPGSSGSGVYNSKKELSGLVFAGNSDFGYAWTVPYEQLVNFVTKEHQHLQRQNINQELQTFGASDDSKHISALVKKCQNVTEDSLINYCNILKRDLLWRKN